MSKEILKLAADTLRLLSADTVQKANSGHPGLPMGMADLMTVLWTGFLRHFPNDPSCGGRDRFILSPGHGSALLYSLLHLSGYDLSMEDLMSFRQWGSRTPGHPEYGHTPGVEVTTGPLGQGFANGVGMAIAAAKQALAAEKLPEKQRPEPVRIWAVVSDGDLMEGITHEAASLAGHLKLDNLIYIYDSNRISIEGSTDLAFTEDVAARFKAYGWKVLHTDAHDLTASAAVLKKAEKVKGAPVLIIASSHIGMGSPNKVDTASVHGAPLGEDELAAAKKKLGFNPGMSFFVPDEVRELYSRRKAELEKMHRRWQKKVDAVRESDPELYRILCSEAEDVSGEALFLEFTEAVTGKALASRAASGNVLQIAAEKLRGLFGGSADLAPSNNSLLKKYGHVNTGDFSGRNMHYGIREHAMGAISNGIALFGGFLPYDATFMVFSDYMRPALRLSSMMRLHTIHIFTHDSIYVGEDGPTHQPVEHTMALRMIPGLIVLRPSDETETAAAWALALSLKDRPVCLALSRQGIAPVDRECGLDFQDYASGAYCVYGDETMKPEIVVLSTGSELPIALEAVRQMDSRRKIRVISVTSHELFREMDGQRRKALIPDTVKLTVSFEAGPAGTWHEFSVGAYRHVGIEHFGASAAADVLRKKYGLDSEGFRSALQAFEKEIF